MAPPVRKRGGRDCEPRAAGYKPGMTDHTKPSDATRQADEASAATEHESDRMPTNSEVKAADDLKPNPETAKNYKEMAERGAHQKGEGRIP